MTTMEMQKQMEITWVKGLAETRKSNLKGKKVDCPYPVMNYSTETGKVTEERVECGVGPGKWCKLLCPYYARHKEQAGRSKKLYEARKMRIFKRMQDEGKAPKLWKNPSPESITNPLGMGGI